MKRRTLVLGIGNTLLTDEGAGVHAVYHLQQRHARPDVQCLDGGTLGFALVEAIESTTRLIVIDAAQLDAEPGRIRVFRDAEMDDFLGRQRKRSVHEVSLIDLMAVACLSDRLPSHRALIGIQPASLDWGDRPSPAVAAALPYACEQALHLIERWAE